MKPSIGRIVVYVLNTGRHRPGIVTDIYASGNVNVQLFLEPEDERSAGPLMYGAWVQNAPQDETKRLETWHWPERE
jgi:hypothetical protein